MYHTNVYVDFCVCGAQRERTEDDKVGKLLDKLERCGPNAFDVFVQALVDTDQQHAAKILTDAVKSTWNVHVTVVTAV